MLYRNLAMVLMVLLLLPAVSAATEVQPGIDALDHLPPSGWNFGPVPLPADFFGPGSDPFDGGIPGDQTALPPLPDCPGDLGETSLLLERLDTAVLPTIPSSDGIDVELIAMSIVSNEPIIVTYGGGFNPEEWYVEISLSPTLPSLGTMTITQTYANGGTFLGEVLLHPFFRFTRVSDGEERTLDGWESYSDMLDFSGPWVYEDPALPCPSCASNFLPGHDGSGKVPFYFTGTLSQHNVQSSCGAVSIPTLSQWGMAIALAILLAFGIFMVRRRQPVRVARSR